MDYEKIAKENGFESALTYHFAKFLDENDPLALLRYEFEWPNNKEKIINEIINEENNTLKTSSLRETHIYLCGHSLGLLPKRTRELINEELNIWAECAVEGHERHPYGRAWINVGSMVSKMMAPIVGAQINEVVVMNALTVNLHFLMASFYRPNVCRSKILMETHSFSSDYYAVISHVRWHGLDPENEVLLLPLEEGQYIWTTEHVLATIDKHAHELAMILLPGIQYYTGQAFDIYKITKYAKSKGIIVGWDLAHAVGNIELKLHEWEVDFAAWCTYKYLNSGPGGIGAVFIHEHHANHFPRLLGWWGNNEKTRFDMINEQFDPLYGALGYQVSNPSVLSVVSLLGSLELFSKVSMSSIRQKSILLTGYLEYLLLSMCSDTYFKIITPKVPEERGAQLSLRFNKGLTKVVFDQLQVKGVIVDLRKPDVIRVAPVPLYNTFKDVFDFVSILKSILDIFAAGNIKDAIIKVRNHNQKVPCTVAWNHIIDYCMNTGRISLALRYFNEMKKRAHFPNAHTFTILLHGFFKNIEHPKSVSYALYVYKSLWLSKYVDRLSIIHINAILQVCAASKQSETAFKIFEEISDNNFVADTITYTILFNILGYENMMDINMYNRRQKILKQVIYLWKAKDLVVDESLVCSIIRSFLQGKKSEDWDFVFTLIEFFFGIKRQSFPLKSDNYMFTDIIDLNQPLSTDKIIKIVSSIGSKHIVMRSLKILRQLDLESLISAISYIKDKYKRQNAISAGSCICHNIAKYFEYLTEDECRKIQMLKEKIIKMQSS
ncbi:hypothetical protein PCANB_002263 [Pneumocystis canis]|nr:hypothetical protein PCANB_002263 [Pneumocystis canis]